jgi:hypothetical protein
VDDDRRWVVHCCVCLDGKIISYWGNVAASDILDMTKVNYGISWSISHLSGIDEYHFLILDNFKEDNVYDTINPVKFMSRVSEV